MQDVRNPQWGFCLAYPAQWKSAPLFGGEVTQLLPQPATSADLQPEIRYGAFRNHLNSEPSDAPKSLEEIADDALDYIKDQMVKQLRVADRRTKIGGEQALITNISYTKEGVPWREKHVRIRRSDEAIIVLQLMAPASKYAGLEPAFDRIAQNTFRPRCSR